MIRNKESDEVGHRSASGASALLRSYLPFPLEMESCVCALCLGDRFTPLLRFDSFGFPLKTVECKLCGLLYVNPRPTLRFLQDFYARRYLYFYEGVQRIDANYLRQRGFVELAELRASRYAPYLRPGLRVLDVGCGAGLFLDIVRRRFPGIGVEGIEPDPSTSEFATRALTLPVFGGFYDSYPERRAFDVICAFHVLEHIYDLQGFVRFVREHLRPDGLFVAEVPNFAGPWDGIGMFHLAHLQTFSPHTLRTLFEFAGFQVLAGGPIDEKVEHSNAYMVGRVAEPGDRRPLQPDPEESRAIALKCGQIRARRAMRVLRTWTKWVYFRLGGIQSNGNLRARGVESEGVQP